MNFLICFLTRNCCNIFCFRCFPLKNYFSKKPQAHLHTTSFQRLVFHQNYKTRTSLLSDRIRISVPESQIFHYRTMKLLTHNMLTSKCIKGVQEGYPLRLKVENIEVKESEFNKDFVVRLLPKIRYDAIYAAAKDAGQAGDLPEVLPENAAESEEFLRKLHHVLLEIEIMAGELVCPETGRVFPIQNGIPNMLLTSEETA